MKDEVNTITLTDLERNLLQFKFEDIESNPYTDFITFEREAIEIARRLLPELLVDTLRELKNGKIPKSALLIKNLLFLIL